MFAFIIRSLGVWIIATGVVAVVIDGMKTIAKGELVLTPLGKAWLDVAPGSLAAVQGAISRYLHPAVWDPGIQWILLVPTWLVLLVLGSALVVLGSRRSRSAAYVV